MPRSFIVLAVLGISSVAFGIGAGPGVAGPMCDLEAPTIVGTPLDDVIKGTPGDDVIVGLAGNDRIYGRGGDDRLCGDEGDDVIDGGGQWDHIDGGVGNDEISDAALGMGGPGDDVITAIPYVNFDFRGESGGEGDDIIRAGDLSMTMIAYGGEGNDLLVGSHAVDEDHDEENPCCGGIGDDLFGGPGDDTIRSRGTWDWVRPGPGNDLVDGGRGHPDVIFYDEHDWGMYVNIDKGIAEAYVLGDRVPELETDRFSFIEDINGTEHDDVLIGDPAPNSIDGCGGDDELYGRGGNDRLWGYVPELYRDTCPGGDGEDFLNGGAGGKDDCVLGDRFRNCEGVYRELDE